MVNPVHHIELYITTGCDGSTTWPSAVGDLPHLDRLRADCVPHGWTELFADRYPQSGGPAHTALFLENPRGFEIEILLG